MPKLFFLMCFLNAKTCPHGVFTFFMVITKESNLVVVKTYGATSFNIFPPLQRLLVNHKCGLTALCCKSHLIFTLSLHWSLFSTYFYQNFVHSALHPWWTKLKLPISITPPTFHTWSTFKLSEPMFILNANPKKTILALS